MIHLYNTRTRRKEPFTPLDPANVRMYVCGPTVYDRAHIGNARPVVVFDVLYRLLRHEYGAEHVTYVRNFTDVDDRIIARAQETLREGETLEAATRRITDETIGWYHEDTDALDALRPTYEPRCTEYIPQMVEMTAELISKGNAYEAEGHVLFAVDSFDRYGALSGRTVDDMIAGSRVEVAPYKRSPMDFVLWKPSTPEQPGWESPWGRGRPGWHIECSAMARALLGEVFDIHGGGIDLAFPHHENELAQSCCAHDTDRMAQVWMHNGFLQVEGEKMAKSAGNFFTVKDLRDRGIPGEVIRYVLLSARYTQPLNWFSDAVENATAALRSLRSVAHRRGPSAQPPQEILDALADDLNTPLAQGLLLSTIQKEVKQGKRPVGDLVAGANLMGLLTDELGDWFDAPFVNDVTKLKIEHLLADRQAARGSKDFARADAIRAQLDAAGVVVMDRPNAPTDWELTPHFDPAKLEAQP